MIYPFSAYVHCTDGRFGKATHIVINTPTETVSHVVVKSGRSPRHKYLVPARWIKETTPELILLGRTKREVRNLGLFEQTDHTQQKLRRFAADPKITELWPQMVEIKKVISERRRRISSLQAALSPGTRVRATDGRIGEVDEFLVNPETWQITHLVIRKGLPWDKKQVSIPIEAIESFDEEVIQLKLTRKEVKALPATPIEK